LENIFWRKVEFYWLGVVVDCTDDHDEAEGHSDVLTLVGRLIPVEESLFFLILHVN
jgi:hypothetical protein